MKSIKSLNTMKLLLLATAVALIVTSCENKPAKESSDAVSTATKENDIKFDNKKLEKDAQFLVDAAAFNLDASQLGRLGQQKGSGNVKGIGQMLAEEHEKALTKVRELAKTKQVTVPDSASNDAMSSYNTLKDKNGNDFDRAYCDRLVESHKKAVEVYEKESSDSRDQDLKEYATTALTDLRKHLDTIFSVQKKVELVKVEKTDKAKGK